MMRVLLVAAALSAAVSTSGCATLITGKTQIVSVTSEPPGARVMLNGTYLGVAPISAAVARQTDYHVVAQLEGYGEGTATIKREINPIAILNLVNVIGWGVDFVTGAAWRLGPETVIVRLQPPAG